VVQELLRHSSSKMTDFVARVALEPTRARVTREKIHLKFQNRTR